MDQMFFALPILALAATTADARRRPRRRERTSMFTGNRTPPSGDGSFHYSSHSSQTSHATCSATVKASTESEAKGALVDVYAQLLTGFCAGFDYVDRNRMSDKLKAIARLTLESKITCTTSGKYAYACADTWAGANSYAGAAYEAYAEAWALVSAEHNQCDCRNDLMASADISVSSFGDIWNQIYAGLDDWGCAGSGNEYEDLPSAIDQDRKVECTARLVYRIFAKATAGAWVRGECNADLESRCEQCCDGLQDCDCEEYTEQCNTYMRNWAKSVATARITITEKENHASCTGTQSDLDSDIEEFTPDFEYTPVVNTPGPVSGRCEAYAETKAYSEAASAQAFATRRLVKSVCKMDQDAPARIKEDAGKIAEVVAEVYNKVTGECSTVGELDLFDGGCAYAKTWVQAFASACAEAFAAAFADIRFGSQASDDCDCNLDGSALAGVLAHETEKIHAQAIQFAEAEACTDGDLYSEVARTCIAKSTAELYAKAVADVLVTNDCVSADKGTYCQGHCSDQLQQDGYDWCIQQCEQEADARANAFADAIATLSLDNVAECNAEALSGTHYYSQNFSLTPEFEDN